MVARISPREILLTLPAEERAQIIATMPRDEVLGLWYDWGFWARPEQLPPDGDWFIWLIQAGRGFGKTRCGAEWVNGLARRGAVGRIALVAPTAADARDTMVTGESGIIACSPPWFQARYEPSRRRVVWPNGVQATMYSAEEPNRIRGGNNGAAWGDELAAWRQADALDQLLMTLRSGASPRVCFTTTPKGCPLFRRVRAFPGVVITRGSTYDNLANLAPSFRETVVAQYAGTRLGRQEIDGDLIEDQEGALWQREWIESARVPRPPHLVRVVVGVDPPATAGGAECGIVVVGVDSRKGAYVLADRSRHGTPAQWSAAVVAAYEDYSADAIIAEVNNGGDMVVHTIRQVPGAGAKPHVKAVHASRGKATRAEPVSQLAEQGRIHHVGTLALLEDQLCQWVPGEEESPDRLDALVWAVWDLIVANERRTFSAGAAGERPTAGYTPR